MILRVRLPFLGASSEEGWSPRARLVFLLVFAVAVLLGARSVFGDKGLLEWNRLRAEERRLELEVAELRRQLREDGRAVLALRDGELAAERIARERLGMARPGEVIYLLPRSGPEVGGASDVIARQGDDAP